MNKHEPHFSCAGCAGEYSWPADHLRTHGGELFCDECWDRYNTSAELGIDFIDLPQFVPEADLKIQALERERNELAAQVERLRYLFNDLCSCNLNSEYRDIEKKIRNILSEKPPSALAALKAQWQAEAFSAFVSTLENIKNEAECSEDTLIKMMVEFSIRVTERHLASVTQRAQEAGNANTDNQAT